MTARGSADKRPPWDFFRHVTTPHAADPPVRSLDTFGPPPNEGPRSDSDGAGGCPSTTDLQPIGGGLFLNRPTARFPPFAKPSSTPLSPSARSQACPVGRPTRLPPAITVRPPMRVGVRRGSACPRAGEPSAV